LPLTDCEEVTISGVRWPLTKVSLHPIRQISLSNESEGPLRIQMASGSASLFLPYDGSPTWTDPRLP
ncbi:MAG TPA: hypothetical protein VG944_21540, partial [Fimbriimonas sp.]|nr:hypothetical protein [Fimbriimonas sp.]